MTDPPRDDDSPDREFTDGRADDERSTDGGATGDRDAPGFDEAAMYRVVREAVEDAILGVLGTLMLVGIGFLAVWAGIAAVVRSGTVPSIAFGAVAVAGGFYLAASALEVIPPAREWF